RNGKWELYDMEADRSELNNLAGAQPERAQALAAMWQSYAERANVIPWQKPRKPKPKPKAKK
ncbi:MAG: arylsulfatase, partial [Planctomycetota bacterium]|nr:arylsulfatase [Planctomycetota bacterium]